MFKRVVKGILLPLVMLSSLNANSNPVTVDDSYEEEEQVQMSQSEIEYYENLGKESVNNEVENNKYIEQFNITGIVVGTTLSGPLSKLTIKNFTLSIVTPNNVLYKIISKEGKQRQEMPINDTAKVKIVKNSDGTYLARIGFYSNEWWRSKDFYNGEPNGDDDSMRFRFKSKKEAEEFSAFLKYLRTNYK